MTREEKMLYEIHLEAYNAVEGKTGLDKVILENYYNRIIGKIQYKIKKNNKEDNHIRRRR